MYRKYYSYSDMPVRRECANEERNICEAEEVKTVHKCEKGNSAGNKSPLDSLFSNGKILGKFELDDVLLLVVILVLLADECDDNLLLLALGFVFISGII